MLTRWIEASMRRSGRVILAFVLLSVAGAWSAWRSPLDAIPDLSDPQVLMSARVPGSPEQIAAEVTRPMMLRLKALPGVRVVRGFSDLGYSYVTVLAEDHADLEAVRARVRSAAAQDAGVPWQVAADASGVGWIYQYALRSPDGSLDLYDLRGLQDSVVAPGLAKLEGVAEVAPVGGYARRFEVVANPRLLEAQGLKPEDLTRALQRSGGELRGRMVMLGERDVILAFAGVGMAPASSGTASSAGVQTNRLTTARVSRNTSRNNFTDAAWP